MAALHLTLQLGYFKASRRFFVYTREGCFPDLEHIRQRYFLHLAATRPQVGANAPS